MFLDHIAILSIKKAIVKWWNKKPNVNVVPSATTDGKWRSEGIFNTAATAGGSRIAGLEQHWEAGAAGILPQSGTKFVQT